MRICLLSQEYPPDSHFGGIGTYTYNIAAFLAQSGHSVHVITSTMSSPASYEERGVKVHRIRQRALRPAEVSRVVYSIQVARKALQLRCPFDIVQASEFRGEAFALGMLRKFPLITRLATPLYLTEQLNQKSSRRQPLFDFEKAQTLRSNGVMSSTKALAKAVAGSWNLNLSAIRIIPNSVDISRIVRLGTGADLPATLAGREFLLYFGRLEERKGVHILAQALPKVFEKFSDLSVVFAGSDAGYQEESMRSYIKRMAGKHQERLIFFDNMPQEKLFPVVHGATLVILPSLWEAFGFVCVEALALARPVLASSGSGFEEIIEDGVSGYLVPPGDPELLSRKIIDILRDRDGRARVSERAKARAAEFDVSRVVPDLVRYYETVRSRTPA
jgi:glycosyltransferase involved in cell wall biosynthesis